ncbi:MAG: response regulator [Polyangiaceae bacterium]|jgi:DNA-binding response OmpR family regulator
MAVGPVQMRVLIADDDPVSLRLLGAALGKMHHEVLIARDGLEAWELFQQVDIPLVVTDWLMPGMSGVELCQNIRAEAREKYSYIVVVTTLSDNENILEGFRAGADDYLVKPFRVDELQRRIGVAERIRTAMSAKVEATLRSAVEMLQKDEDPPSPSLVQSVKNLGEFYRSEGAYAKARAFLRRQIALVREARGGEGDLAKLQRELKSLEGLQDERV